MLLPFLTCVAEDTRLRVRPARVEILAEEEAIFEEHRFLMPFAYPAFLITMKAFSVNRS